MNKRTVIAWIVVLASVFSLWGCGNSEVSQQTNSTLDTGKSSESSTSSENTEEKGGTGVYTKITAEEAYEMMKNQEVIIVDVRTEAEYKTGFIPNAVLIPNESIGDTPPAELPDKDATILLYCRSGNRSAQAANKLIKMGYTKVYDFGGINSWPYDIKKP
ncbi:MAG: rhodanese-like domain-containing protein [Bacillota bacterium]|nr:rhodanese-like domain-containing protein [Bacillota bacterium]